jgi:predicted FMN-binding regulatory protein PaiB
VDVPLAYLDRALDPSRPTCQLHQYYHCVIIRGKGSVVEDTNLKVTALNALVAKHEGHDAFDRVSEDMPGFKACHVIEIKPESVSAKSDFSQNQPEEKRHAIAEYLFKRNRPGDREAVKAMGYTFG